MRLPILALAAVLALAGCGGDDGVTPPAIDARAIDAAVDAPPPALTVSIAASVARAEGSAGLAMGTVLVSLSAASTTPVTVSYASADGTAIAPADYTAVTGSVTIAPGTTTRTITFEINGDRVDENDETFTVTLTDPQGAELGNPTATVTITDDDATPTVTMAAATAGESAPLGLGFEVRLSAASGLPVMVTYATASDLPTDTASLADYTSATGTVELLPGETTKSIAIALTNDVFDETDETLRVVLSAPVNATLVTTQATGTITDDDPLPTLAVAPVSALESAAAGLGFVVSLSVASGKPVMVTYATSNGTASAGDYTSTPGMLLFMPGETARTVAVPITADVLDEPDETVLLTLSAPSNATIATAQGVGTIVDDDASPTVAIAAAATLIEGNAGATTGAVAVTLSEATAVPVTVSYEAVDGSATAIADYAEPSGTLTFLPGTTTMMIAIDAVGDTLDEDDETFAVRLIAAHGATIAGPTSAITIADDDAPPALAAAPVTAAEGAPRGLAFVVTLSAASAKPVTVGYATTSVTASAADYTGASGTLEFLPGETARTVALVLANDALDEPDETVQLTLAAPTNATIVAADALGTIADDDQPPSLAIDDVSATERDALTTTLSFPVTLSAPSGGDVTVQYGTTAGTAAAGLDYVTAAGMLTIPAGATTGAIDITIVGDATVELDEAFTVTLSAPTGAAITAPATATGTLLNDDGALPRLTIDDPTVAEGNAGATDLVFTVALDAAAAGPVSVGFATASGTATDQPGVGGADYVVQAGTVTFAPGDLTRTITVQVIGDVNDEADETVRLVLAGPNGALLADAEGAGQIADDDAAPAVTVAPVTVAENLATAGFTVGLSVASGRTVTVAYATVDGAAFAGGHAGLGGQDYVARAGTLTFLPGEISKAVAITINADLLDEPDESFALALTGASGATIATATVDALITDDDATPTLAIADLARVEGQAMGVVAVPVTLSAASGRTITVQYATGDAPAPTATAGADYVTGAGTLTFPPGVTSQLVTVTLLGDAGDEVAERFVIDLGGPSNAAIDDAQGLVTLVNDDSPLPSIAIGNPPSVTEAVAANMMTFTVSLSAAATAPVTVNYTTTLTGTARSAVDFTAVAGALTFTPGQTSKTIAVPILLDMVDESVETVLVTLAGASVNVNVLDAVGQGSLLDNDAAPTLSVANVSLAEGSGAVTTATFTVTLAPVSGQAVAIAYATRDGTASSAAGLGLDDYETRSGVLSFPAGTTTRTVTVPIASDRILEPNETFVLDLGAPTGATLATASATATITNDDAVPSLVVAGMQIAEGPGGVLTPLVFAITMSAPALAPVTVTFATTNGTAAAGVDYLGQTATVTFAPGATALNRTVFVIGDGVMESNETFTGRLSGAMNANIGTASATATITNDD